MPVDGLGHAPAHVPRLVDLNGRHDDHELIPAVADQQVIRADGAGQNAGDELEHEVARWMTVRVVDRLKSV